MLSCSINRYVVYALLVSMAVTVGACGASTTRGSANAVLIHVTVTPGGCKPKPNHVVAGPINIAATNLDAPTVSEVEVRTINLSHVMGEKENLIEGLSAQFSALLTPGKYVITCPGAAQSHWLLIAKDSAKPSTS